jgi:hypothetical protein
MASPIPLPDDSDTLPFTRWGFVHRERDFTIDELRKIKAHIFILSDLDDVGETDLLSRSDGLLRSLDELSNDQIAHSAFYVYFSTDDAALASIARIIQCGGAFIPPMSFGKRSYRCVKKHVEASLAESEKAIGFLFGPVEVHENICQAVDITRDVPGDFLEIGVFSGSTAMTAMTHMRNVGLNRKCWLMDTFEGFVYSESQRSSDIIWCGTHEMSGEVHRLALSERYAEAEQDVTLVTGNICRDDLPQAIVALALVNLDVDLYEATLSALTKVAPLVQHRGMIICEDPASTPGCYGASLAMNEFLETETGTKFQKVFLGSQYFLIRVS